jgi:hypothetical protein
MRQRAPDAMAYAAYVVLATILLHLLFVATFAGWAGH